VPVVLVVELVHVAVPDLVVAAAVDALDLLALLGLADALGGVLVELDDAHVPGGVAVAKLLARLVPGAAGGHVCGQPGHLLGSLLLMTSYFIMLE